LNFQATQNHRQELPNRLTSVEYSPQFYLLQIYYTAI